MKSCSAALPTAKAVVRGSRILAGSPNVTLRVLGASKLLKFNHSRVDFIREVAYTYSMNTFGNLTKIALTIILNTTHKT